MPKISVIVPCYNVEKYIDRCMKSIVTQTIGIDNLEVILVNDASTDGTLNKVMEWEAQYPDNIIVVTYEQNLRQGGARNLGLQYASSKYIGFVDSDDWIEPDMYELLYQKAEEKQYDMVRGKYIRDSGMGGSYVLKQQEDKEYIFEAVSGYYKGEYAEVGNNGELGGIWSGIYRKDVIVNNSVYFPEGLVYEDNYWGAILSLYIQKSYIIDRVMYHYALNMDSTITRRDDVVAFDRLKIELLKLQKYEELGVLGIEEFKDKIEWEFILYYYLNTMFTIFTKFLVLPVDVVNEMIRQVNERFPNWKNNPYIEKTYTLNKQILGLLKVKRCITLEELVEIRKMYLEIYSLKWELNKANQNE